MSARQMSARFSSVCGVCAAPIRKGAPILYVKGLPASHADCGEPVFRGGAGRGFMLDGRVFRGRCEDAPCCGCCS